MKRTGKVALPNGRGSVIGSFQSRSRQQAPFGLFLLAAALLLAGCAYTGPPLPPLANVPGRVADLAAIQRGGYIIAQFTPPALTTEGMAIKEPPTFDLRIGPAGEPFDIDEWSRVATRQAPAEVAASVRYEIPSAPWTGKAVILAVRAIGSNGKAAAWSNYVVLTAVPAPATPAGLTAQATNEGVRLTWSGPESGFRVVRRGADEKIFNEVATVNGREWLDRNAEFGKQYAYMVLGLTPAGDGPPAESELAGPVSVTPVDTFPPATPEGLQASAAPNSVELTWERNAEPDLAGYRVYRAEAGGQFASLADISLVPSYSDRAAAHDKTYRYAVSALDRAGNESPRSAAVEVAFP